MIVPGPNAALCWQARDGRAETRDLPVLVVLLASGAALVVRVVG